MTDIFNAKYVLIIDMNQTKMQESLMDRLDFNQTIKVMQYIISEKHESTNAEDLK